MPASSLAIESLAEHDLSCSSQVSLGVRAPATAASLLHLTGYGRTTGTGAIGRNGVRHGGKLNGNKVFAFEVKRA
jgi:hypothetical protein